MHNNPLFLKKCLIGNKWLDAYSKHTSDVINPATESIIGTVPSMGTNETKEAIDIANQALPKWKNKTAVERSQLLRNWHDLIIKNTENIASILTTEQGKPIANARGEVQYAAAFIEWFAEEAKRIYGMTIPGQVSVSKIIVSKEPVGVCAAITPWNFPAAMIARKVAPALATGCTTVIKPAPETPFTALALAKLALEAGIDPGVINVITGEAEVIGRELTTNRIVRKLSFTGSTEVGKLLFSQCANTMKKMSMELGGNAPMIICAGADLDNAIQGVISSKYRNSGQTCICANRIIVQDVIYDEFSKRLIQAAKKLVVGNGFDEGVTQGPLINREAIDRIQELISDAVDKGANIDLGGKSHKLGKLFFEPTVISNANATMRCYKEEIFAPIAPLFKFSTTDEAIGMANDTNFGLASYVYSNDLTKAWDIADNLEYGMVGINAIDIASPFAPFGGIKESGLGIEGSCFGVEEYLEMKCISIK